LRAAVAAAPDWDCVIAGARRHRLTAALLAGLQGSKSAAVPDDVLCELRRDAQAAAPRSPAQGAEVRRLSAACAAAGVRVLALKGVVLSAQLYGDATLRETRDIDLLVDPQQVSLADAVLIAAGYRRLLGALSPRQSAAYRRWIKEIQYVHPV